MRFLTIFGGFFLVVSLCNGALVQRRTYRNMEEILVPVAIIQDDEEIKAPTIFKESLQETEPVLIVEDKVVAAEVADEATIEDEINKALQTEKDKEDVQNLEMKNEMGNTLAEGAQIISIMQSDPSTQVDQKEKGLDYQPVVLDTTARSDAALIEKNSNGALTQPEGAIRQATQATPTQSTAQPSFVQLIQNSFGQLLNPQLPTLPTLPPLPTFNPLAAFQQFANNIGFNGFGGQQQGASKNTTTVRPPGPIQQFVSNFVPQSGQPSGSHPGPLQSLINFVQGRPQEPTAQPQSIQPTETVAPSLNEATSTEIVNNSAEEVTNISRESSESNDSFEESVQPNEIIVVGDDAGETKNYELRQVTSVPT